MPYITDLPAAAVQKMLKAGISGATLRKLQLGQLDPRLAAAMAREYGFTLGGSLSPPSPEYNNWPKQAERQATAPRYDPGTRTITTNWGNRDTRQPTIPTSTHSATPQSSVPLGKKLLDVVIGSIPTSWGSGTTPPPSLPSIDLPPIPDIPPGGGVEWPTPPSYDPLPDFPDLPDLNIPVVTPRDFTPQAEEAMNKAYAPLFAGIEASRGNVRQQGDRATAMTGGAYDEAIKTLASNAATNKAENAAAIAENKTQGEALSESIGANYTGNAQEVAQTLKNLGIETAAEPVLGEAGNEAAWQQGQAEQSTAAQADYLTNQGLADTKYATDMSDVVAGQKATTASDIAEQVTQNLFQLDQIKTGYDADKIARAIEMAMSLRSEDIGLQQYNAQNSITQQQSAIDEVLARYQSQVNSANVSNENRQSAFQNIMAIREQQQNANQQRILNEQWRAGMISDVAYKEQQLKLEQQRLALDAQIAAGRQALDEAELNKTEQPEGPKPSGLQESRERWASQGPGNDQVWDAMYQLAMDLTTSGEIGPNPKNYADVLARARAWAVQNGKNEHTTAMIMDDILQNTGIKF